MHDRRVDEETLTFGNESRLFKKAMTWWDHGTGSIWSQPWGTAIVGPLKGTALTLIPASVVPWSTWLAEHPDTTVVANDLDKTRAPPALVERSGQTSEGIDLRRAYANTGRDDFVIGVALEGSATAYPYRLAADRRVINDRVGKHPVVVLVNPETRNIKVYLRQPSPAIQGQVTPQELLFELDDVGQLVDGETGSIWDVGRGVATGGTLRGAALQPVPYVTSFVWAWHDFFPHSAIHEQE